MDGISNIKSREGPEFSSGARGAAGCRELDIYDAFGRGDIPAILDKIAPGCRWESWENNRAQREGVPTLQPRTGPAGVAAREPGMSAELDRPLQS